MVKRQSANNKGNSDYSNPVQTNTCFVQRVFEQITGFGQRKPLFGIKGFRPSLVASRRANIRVTSRGRIYWFEISVTAIDLNFDDKACGLFELDVSSRKVFGATLCF